jgi:hypothetical protein
MAQEGGRRARKRYKNAPSYAEVKAGIDAKEKAAAERKAARSAAKKPLTPAERYEQEKAARKDKSGSFSQHRMSGSRGHGSEYQNTRSIREEVLSYLLDEGFASDEKSAEAIMGAMSEGWMDVILTEKTKKTEVAPAASEAASRANQQDVVGAAIQANPDAFKRATESEAKRRRKARERNL